MHTGGHPGRAGGDRQSQPPALPTGAAACGHAAWGRPPLGFVVVPPHQGRGREGEEGEARARATTAVAWCERRGGGRAWEAFFARREGHQFIGRELGATWLNPLTPIH